MKEDVKKEKSVVFGDPTSKLNVAKFYAVGLRRKSGAGLHAH
jgi:hypothetical protein